VIQKKQTRVRLEDLIAELGPLCNNEEKAELLDLSSAFASTPPEDHKALEHIETSFKALDRQVRTGPCVELLIDVMACSDRKVTAHQNEVFKRAGKLVDRYVESDHGRKLSPAEIGEMKQMHEEMSKAYPDLPTWRKEKLDEYGGDPVIAAMSMTNADIRSGS
jgi:hypothetical protein